MEIRSQQDQEQHGITDEGGRRRGGQSKSGISVAGGLSYSAVCKHNLSDDFLENSSV